MFTTTIPEDRFPLRQELLGRTAESGALGDVARELAAGVVSCAALGNRFQQLLARVTAAGHHVYLPLIAQLRPAGTMWVEMTRPEGGLYGLLFGSCGDRHVWARHIDGGRGGAPARSLPSAAARCCPAMPSSLVDWTALEEGRWQANPEADAIWVTWAARFLALEAVGRGFDPSQATEQDCETGVSDLVMAAIAHSPIVFRNFLASPQAEVAETGA